MHRRKYHNVVRKEGKVEKIQTNYLLYQLYLNLLQVLISTIINIRYFKYKKV